MFGLTVPKEAVPHARFPTVTWKNRRSPPAPFPPLRRGGSGGWGRALDTENRSRLDHHREPDTTGLRCHAMNQFFNRKSETNKRRQLRGSMPDAEVILWSRLKGRQLLGCKFRRQYGVGSFVI